jgi:DNA-binding protein H-NS
MNRRALEKLSISQLRDLSKLIDVVVAEKQKSEKADIKAKVAALVSKAGLSITDLFDGRSAKRGKRSPAAIKYRDPKNPENTWTGRGRKPLWMAGVRNVERFRV